MSDMQMPFADPTGPDAAQFKSGRAGAALTMPVPQIARHLRLLLHAQIAETDQLYALLCILNVPMLHLCANLTLRYFTPAAATVFGISAADLGRSPDSFGAGVLSPVVARSDLVAVCQAGKARSRIAFGPDGKIWLCRLLPHVMRNQTGQGVIAIMVAQSAIQPVARAPVPTVNLTTRQHQVMELVLAGHPSKNIAADLAISQRTVENHRAAIMRKTGATSLPALARLAVGASVGGYRKASAGPIARP